MKRQVNDSEDKKPNSEFESPKEKIERLENELSTKELENALLLLFMKNLEKGARSNFS